MGASSLIVPAYIAELAPVPIRGGLVILQQLAISGGILLAYLLDFAGWGWRPMFAAAVIPAIALGVGMLFMSISPLFWLMSAEVFPNRLRGAGATAATVANWSANLLVTVTFLSLIGAVGKPWTFWIYAIMAGLALVFVAVFVPETKGRPLEHIDRYWLHDREWPQGEGAH